MTHEHDKERRQLVSRRPPRALRAIGTVVLAFIVLGTAVAIGVAVSAFLQRLLRTLVGAG
jgi:hypothetical protein